MALQTGVNKKLIYKKETTWGTKATASGGRYLRRVTSSLDLNKDTFSSNEIVSHAQISDYRHGARKVSGSVNGELSPGSYLEFMAAACRKDFVAVTNITAVSLTMASGTLVNGFQTYNLTRAAGNWYTDGVRSGMVIKVTAGLTGNNLNKNLLVLSMTSATAIVVIALNNTALTAEGPTSSTVTIPGKITYVPASGHTNDAFSIEHFFADITQSEVYTGCRVASLDVQLPASGMSTVAVEFVGKDVEVAAAQYFNSGQVGPSTKGTIAAVNGIVRAGANPSGVLTGLNFKVNANANTGAVVGSVYSPDVFVGRVVVTGQFTVYFDSVTHRDAFLNETEVSLAAAFATGSGNAADFIAFALPRVKIGGASKSDGEQGLILTCPFQALYNSDGSATDGDENTTLWIQDSNDTMA